MGHLAAKPTRLYGLLTVSAILILYSAPLYSQVYSYLDENGVRVLTNLPPTGPVRDLKVSGVVPTVSPASTTQAQSGHGNTKAQPTSSNAVPRSQAVSSGTKGAHSGSVPAQAKKDPADYDAIIEKYASQFGMDPDLIRYMIATESAFNERAVSPKGAQGLMQLMPETASRLGVRDPFDPDENIWGGTKYMRFLYDTFSSSPDALKLSLAAYNAGENVVLQLGRVPPIRETKDYVQSIINRYGQTTMKVSDLVPERQLFKFIDQNGVLNLTNLPPVLPSASVRTHEGPRPIFR